MTADYEHLFDYIQTLEIIDTHEHLPAWEGARDMERDLLGEYLFHYLSSDLVSAGLPKAMLEVAKDPARPLLERWGMLEPYWEFCRHTGYARSLDRSVKLLYDEERIDATTIEALNDKFKSARREGRVYRRVLKEIGRIEICLLDYFYPGSFINGLPDPEYMTPVLNIQGLVNPCSTEMLQQMERVLNLKITGFDSYCEAVEAAIRQHAQKGSKLLKCALAYQRPIDFGRPDRQTARREYGEAISGAVPSPGAEFAELRMGRVFQDYVMHRILEVADGIGMTFQFHTGLQEGNGNYIDHSDPALLTPLVMMYRNVVFDLFHISYPFAGKAAVMAKNFPNVTLDMCWAHIISPRASVATLLEWLDMVPYSKISGFGGDYCFIDGVAGHQAMARENIARALSIQCGEGIIDGEEAKRIAKALLYDNPKRIFLKGR